MALYLLRGAPASGKSDWIEEHDLDDITVSSDKVRIELFGLETGEDGRERIPQRNQRRVWSEIGKRIEKMLDEGGDVILDAQNLKTKDIETQVRRAQEHGSECYIVDFWSDLTPEECKRRNRAREEYKQVPDFVIDRFYETVRANVIPTSVRAVFTPEEAAMMIRC